MPLLPINWINLLAARGGFSAEYQAVYDSFTTKPGAAVAAAQNEMVSSLVALGVWDKLHWQSLFADEYNNLLNWSNPGTDDPTTVGSPVFTSLEGITGANGKYINTNYNLPGADPESISIGLYLRKSGVNSDYHGVTQTGSSELWIIPVLSGSMYTRIATTGNITTLNTGSQGMFISSRQDDANIKMAINGVIADKASAGLPGLPNLDVYFLARNNDGSPIDYTTNQIAFAFVGEGLTDTNITDLTDTVEVYMDSNGKGVIT